MTNAIPRTAESIRTVPLWEVAVVEPDGGQFVYRWFAAGSMPTSESQRFRYLVHVDGAMAWTTTSGGPFLPVESVAEYDRGVVIRFPDGRTRTIPWGRIISVDSYRAPTAIPGRPLNEA